MDAYWHTPLALSMAAAVLLAGVVGVLVGLPVLRLRGVFLAIATIGFIEALRLGVILNLPITGEGLGLKNDNADPLGGIYLVLVSLLVVLFLVWRLTKGRLGAAWAAIRQDELAALSQGIDVARYKMIAFVLSAILAGFAGALEADVRRSQRPAIRRHTCGSGIDLRGARWQRQLPRAGGRSAGGDNAALGF